MDKVKSGELIPLWQTGAKRGSDSKHIPLIQEVMGDERAKQVFKLVGAPARLGRSLLAPPGLPDARLKVLRTSFDNLVADQAFAAEVKRRGLLFDPASGEEVDQTIKDIFSQPEDIVELARKAMSDGYQENCINCGDAPKKKKKSE
jgi:tripartite-type tricarboxylate transporter receptor subunit TctC